MRKNLFCIIVLAASVVACNKAEVTGPQVGAPVQFRASVVDEFVMKSTTIDNPIDDGSFVGIYAAAPIGVSNKKYAKTESAMTLTPESGQTISWLIGQNGTQDFYAYYPWKSEATASAIPVAVQTDQKTLANLNASDFLWGIDDDRAAGTASSITLNHKLTRVIINIDNNLSQDVTGVAITGLKHTATADPATGALSSLDGSGDIEAYHNSAEDGWSDDDSETVDTRNRQYIAIVLPEANVSPTIQVTIAGSLVYTFTCNSYSFVGGTTATASITINPGDSEAGSEVSFAFSVGTWSSGSAMTGTLDNTPTKPAYKWSIIGTINGSNWNQDFYMESSGSPDEGREDEVVITFNYAAGDAFKLRYNNDWGTQAGASTSDPLAAGSDITLAGSNNHDIILSGGAGSYTIYFDPSDYHFWINKN